eukprot:scaffold124382_cov72-Phaeocystis_antarctica.AAC.2
MTDVRFCKRGGAPIYWARLAAPRTAATEVYTIEICLFVAVRRFPPLVAQVVPPRWRRSPHRVSRSTLACDAQGTCIRAINIGHALHRPDALRRPLSLAELAGRPPAPSSQVAQACSAGLDTGCAPCRHQTGGCGEQHRQAASGVAAPRGAGSAVWQLHKLGCLSAASHW